MTKGALAFIIGRAAIAWRLAVVRGVWAIVGALAFLWGGARRSVRLKGQRPVGLNSYLAGYDTEI